MRRLFRVAVLSTGLFLASASAAQAPYVSRQANDFCYFECQLRCYVAQPGGGAGWRACYLACAADRCGWVPAGAGQPAANSLSASITARF